MKLRIEIYQYRTVCNVTSIGMRLGMGAIYGIVMRQMLFSYLIL